MTNQGLFGGAMFMPGSSFRMGTDEPWQEPMISGTTKEMADSVNGDALPPAI